MGTEQKSAVNIELYKALELALFSLNSIPRKKSNMAPLKTLMK